MSAKSKRPCVKCCANGELARRRKVYLRYGFCIPLQRLNSSTFFMPLSTGNGGFFMQKKKNSKLKGFNSVKSLCTAALLCALCVVISYVCKSFTVTMSVRVTFENLPLILSGIILGPIPGLLTGLCADVVSTAASQYGFGGINPILTIGSASVGFLAGFLPRFVFKKRSALQVFTTVFFAHIAGNMIIKSLGLYLYYSTPPVEILIRILVYIGIAAAEAFIINVLLKSKGIKKAIGGLEK